MTAEAIGTTRDVTNEKGTGAFSRFERMVAYRYLRPRRKHAFIAIISILSCLGIMFGVMTLIIVMSVMNGFRAELLGKILGLNGHVLIQGQAGKLLDYDSVEERVLKVKGVTRAAPIIDGEVLATGAGGSTGALIRGMRAEDLKTQTVVSSTLFDNQLPAAGGTGDIIAPPPLAQQKGPVWDAHRAEILSRFQGNNAVIIGGGLADRLGLQIGDAIKVTAPNGAQTPFGIVPRSNVYRIVGFFRMGMSEYDSRIIFMPLEEAQDFFNYEGAVSAVEVMIHDPDNVTAIRLPMYEAAGPGNQVVDWMQLNSSFFSALQVERNVMFFILTLIVFVAALNIISGLIMLVKEKSADIAILRTMGSSSGAIMRIFFMVGGTIGIVGTAAGFIIGVAFCANIEGLRQILSKVTGTNLFDPTIYFLSELPAKINPHEVVAVVAISLTLSFLATLIPSWSASRIDPVEALRYE